MDVGVPDVALSSADALGRTSLARATQVQQAAKSGDGVKAAKMFEELLASLMVHEMRRGLEDGFFGGGPGSDVYEGWLDEHVGRALSDSHALDLAQSIRVSLGSKAQTATGETR